MNVDCHYDEPRDLTEKVLASTVWFDNELF